jgi:hypothetical protein
MRSVEIRDARRPARVTFSWEHPKGFRSPLVRVGLDYGEELHVSARVLPGMGPGLTRFVENLASLASSVVARVCSWSDGGPSSTRVPTEDHGEREKNES